MGGKLLGFTDYGVITTKNRTKREKLLAEMKKVVHSKALISSDPGSGVHGTISPVYPGLTFDSLTAVLWQ